MIARTSTWSGAPAGPETSIFRFSPAADAEAWARVELAQSVHLDIARCIAAVAGAGGAHRAVAGAARVDERQEPGCDDARMAG